jgi:hypothetical protein
MASVMVGNTTPGPLYLNLSNERTLKIPARGTAEVNEADLDSPELLFHRRQGHIVILGKP